jgi:hypothetical protein
MKNTAPLIIASFICTIAILGNHFECQIAKAKSATAAPPCVAAFKHTWTTTFGKEVDVEIVRQNEGLYVVRFSRNGQSIELVASPPLTSVRTQSNCFHLMMVISQQFGLQAVPT